MSIDGKKIRTTSQDLYVQHLRQGAVDDTRANARAEVRREAEMTIKRAITHELLENSITPGYPVKMLVNEMDELANREAIGTRVTVDECMEWTIIEREYPEA